jgi:hypothetical protein
LSQPERRLKPNEVERVPCEAVSVVNSQEPEHKQRRRSDAPRGPLPAEHRVDAEDTAGIQGEVTRANDRKLTGTSTTATGNMSVGRCRTDSSATTPSAAITAPAASRSCLRGNSSKNRSSPSDVVTDPAIVESEGPALPASATPF